MKKNWILLRSLKGILAIGLGFVALFFPEITMMTVAMSFGLFALSGGIFLMIASIKNRKIRNDWIIWLGESLIDIFIGGLILLHPGVSITVFFLLLGIWAVIMGIILFITFLRLRKIQLERDISLFLSIISVIFGLLMVWNPFASAMIIAILLAIYGFIYGISTIISTIKLYRSTSM